MLLGIAGWLLKAARYIAGDCWVLVGVGGCAAECGGLRRSYWMFLGAAGSVRAARACLALLGAAGGCWELLVCKRVLLGASGIG